MLRHNYRSVQLFGGGGLTILALAYKKVVVNMDNVFIKNNKGDVVGGVLLLISAGEGSINIVMTSSSVAKNNLTRNRKGGGVGIFIIRPSTNKQQNVNNNNNNINITFSNMTILANTGAAFGGGMFIGYPNYLSGNALVTIKGCLVILNMATREGHAIYATSDSTNIEEINIYNISIIMEDSAITRNGEGMSPFNIDGHYHKEDDWDLLKGSTMKFVRVNIVIIRGTGKQGGQWGAGQFIIQQNTGSGIALTDTNITFNGLIKISQSHAIEGQSILLKELSYLFIKGPANISLSFGEGYFLYSMISAVASPYGQYKSCPIQFIDDSNDDISVHFVDRNNPVTLIYSDGLQHCNKSFSRYFTDSVRKYFASPPIALCICNALESVNSNASCLTHFPDNTKFHKYPGEDLSLQLTASNYKNQSSPAALEINALGRKHHNNKMSITQSILFLKHQCSIVTVPLLKCKGCYELEVGYMIPQTLLAFKVYVDFLSCPLGFELSYSEQDGLGRCTCHPYLIEENIVTNGRCDINTATLGIRAQSWFGEVTIQDNILHPVNDNSSNNSVIAYADICPVGFCKKGVSSVNVLIADSLCRTHRTGVLCGGCTEGYSEMFSSTECGKCSNTGLFYLLALAVYGIIIVLIFFTFRVTVSESYLAGCFFYSAMIMVSIKEDIIYTNQPLIGLFYGLLNMEFSFKHCVYNGMNNLVKTSLAYLLPIYLWLIVGALVLVSKKSSKISNVISQSSIQVLATLCFMSFSKVLRSIVTTFTYTSLKTQQGNYLVWFGDGNVMYWRNQWHASLMILAGIMTITYVLPFMLWTTFCSVALHCKCVRKRRNLVDVFHGQYREGWGWLFGARLFILSLSQLFYVYYRSKSLVTLLSLYVISLSPLTFIQVYWKPFRNKHVNGVESFVLVNLLLVEIITLYQEMSGKKSMIIVAVLLYSVLIKIIIGLAIKVIKRMKYTLIGRKARVFGHYAKMKLEKYKCIKRREQEEGEMMNSRENDTNYREPLLNYLH
uniref:Uncharacterized protein n=1 Tax=Amphimedon queenslandica TaxID=400682 RepID=A0A1X7TTE4_AMPQE